MSETEEDEATRRRRWLLIRVLLVLGIGIPIVIEGLTFAGLVQQQLLAPDDGNGAGTATPTVTPARSVGIGDELLPETSQPETVTTATIRARPGSWVFTFGALVNNTGTDTYQLQLQSVTTSEGRTVSNASVVRLAPGEEGVVTAQWTLSEGSTPRRVTVIATTGSGGNASTIRREIPIERPAVQGS